MSPTPLYSALAQLRAAIGRCENAPAGTPAHDQHLPRYRERLAFLLNALPCGSGFDNGVTLIENLCRSNRLVFNADFHHMNSHGGYDGWSHHQVIVTPSLSDGFVIRVTGRARNQIKDYIADTLHHALSGLVDRFAPLSQPIHQPVSQR
jgi:hypothetical protein